jgi:ATP-dependent DNA ligase
MWVAETKWDGCRLQLRFDGKRLCLRTRPGRDCTAEFPELYPLAKVLPARKVVDGGQPPARIREVPHALTFPTSPHRLAESI